MNESGAPVLATRGISKRFGSIEAVRSVDIEVSAGEVVGLVGDNGAGKSTLVNMLSGSLQPTSGSILLNGEEVHFRSALEARGRGIETVYQDLALALELTVWANLFLGREKTVGGVLGRLGWLDRKAMSRVAQKSLERTRIRIGSVQSKPGQLSGGQRQAIAVARAVTWGSKILLLDEPTAALGVEQQQRVAELIRTVSGEGLPVLLVSHNLLQVNALCDRVLVLFQGRLIANLRPAEAGGSVEEIVSWITGAALTRRGNGD
jgi:ABC-type sugar transport system ATPase subunit